MAKRLRKSAINLYIVVAIVLVVAIAANVAAMSFSSVISVFLGQETSRVDASAADISVDTQYYKSDYTKLTALDKDETAYAKTVQTEGSVLLKNGNASPILPIKTGAAVTLLGTGSTSNGFLLSGGGSGSIDTSHTPSLKEAFESAGYKVNKTVSDFYETGAGRSYRANDSIGLVGEAPVNELQSVRASFASYNDAAIVVISRMGSEGQDVSLTTQEDPDRHYLELSQDEMDLIDLAVSEFNDVIVLLNTVNPMELGYFENLNVAVLWVGIGGEIGIAAIPDMLNGTTYPSGKLVDTYVYDNFSAPAMQNFGNFTYSDHDGAYVSYAEGIYVGYKYYETRYADVVTGRANVGNFDYASTVLYPFGYGISYTAFDYSNFKLTESGDSITLSVDVKNTGSNAGKEAVEFYMQAPYTDFDIQNGIEKSAIQLVGYGKTAELAPNATEKVTVTISKEMMRAYDSKVNKTYIVEAGDYYFAVGTDVHDALNNILAKQGYTIANGMTADGNATMTAVVSQAVTDTETYSYGVDGNKITNQFDNVDLNYYMPYTYLSRSNWTGTWPATLGGEEHTMPLPSGMDADLSLVHAVDPAAVMPATGAEFKVDLATMTILAQEDGETWDRPEWEDLLNQMSAKEMMDLVALGGFHTEAVASVGKTPDINKDGPAGISSTLIGGAGCFGYGVEVLLASTWNIELATQMGNFVGEDGIYSGVAGWYAPGLNTHRTPFGGRNFEYYSEDSVQSGQFGAAVVAAARAKGLCTYMKHFALNDSETNRGSVNTFATEQAVREIYLRPFEITVLEGNSLGVMVAMNYIGAKWCGAHRGLMTNVLRNEWGFKGTAITDYAGGYSQKLDSWDGIAAGTDLWLCSLNGAFEIEDYASNATVMSYLRICAKRILYMSSLTNGMNGTAPGATIVKVTPPWQIALIVIDVVLGLLAVAGIVLATKRLQKAKKALANGDIDEEIETRDIPLYNNLSITALAVTVVGVILEIIGAVLSPAVGVGMNTNLSPVLFVGAAIILCGFIFTLVIKALGTKTGASQKITNIARIVAIVALVFAVVCIAGVIFMPVLMPANG